MNRDCCSQGTCGSATQCRCAVGNKNPDGGRLTVTHIGADGFTFCGQIKPTRGGDRPMTPTGPKDSRLTVEKLAESGPEKTHNMPAHGCRPAAVNLTSPDETDELKQAVRLAIQWLEHQAYQCSDPEEVIERMTTVRTYGNENKRIQAATNVADLLVNKNQLPADTDPKTILNEEEMRYAIGWLIRSIANEDDEAVLRGIAKFIRDYGNGDPDQEAVLTAYGKHSDVDGFRVVFDGLDMTPPDIASYFERLKADRPEET